MRVDDRGYSEDSIAAAGAPRGRSGSSRVATRCRVRKIPDACKALADPHPNTDTASPRGRAPARGPGTSAPSRSRPRRPHTRTIDSRAAGRWGCGPVSNLARPPSSGAGAARTFRNNSTAASRARRPRRNVVVGAGALLRTTCLFRYRLVQRRPDARVNFEYALSGIHGDQTTPPAQRFLPSRLAQTSVPDVQR